MLSEQAISKFRELYRARFGKEINRTEAYKEGTKLLRLVELVFQPMTETEYKKVLERRRDTTIYK